MFAGHELPLVVVGVAGTDPWQIAPAHTPLQHSPLTPQLLPGALHWGFGVAVGTDPWQIAPVHTPLQHSPLTPQLLPGALQGAFVGVASTRHVQHMDPLTLHVLAVEKLAQLNELHELDTPVFMHDPATALLRISANCGDWVT